MVQVVKKKLTCKDCHRYIRVNGKDACCNVGNPLKDTFKLLKSLDICSKFWKIDVREIKRELPKATNGVFVANCKRCLK